MWGERTEHHDAPRAYRYGRGLGPVRFATDPSEVAEPMSESASQMAARNHPRTTVVESRVVQSDPAGEVSLGLYVGVAVVLMPGERLGEFGFFVDCLIPIEPHVGAD